MSKRDLENFPAPPIYCLTKDEYCGVPVYSGSQRKARLIPDNLTDLVIKGWEHQAAVCDAIAAGLIVPAEVLAGYGYDLVSARKQVESQRGITIQQSYNEEVAA